MPKSARILTLTLLLVLNVFGEKAISFDRDIQPILSENCYYCHGTDPEHREGDLRLDFREDALDAGAIVPGKPEKSELIDRIHSKDSDDLMPPPDSKRKLTSPIISFFETVISGLIICFLTCGIPVNPLIPDPLNVFNKNVSTLSFK